MEPELLLLDEVMAGLRGAEIDEAMELIRAINARGHDDPDHRARHEGDRRHLPAGGGAGLRPPDRRGHARRGHQRTRP